MCEQIFICSAFAGEINCLDKTKTCIRQSWITVGVWQSDIIVVLLLSCFWLFEIPWTAARQASLSFTISHSFLKLTCIELMMPSNHLILCCPLSPPALNLSQHQSLFRGVSSSHQVTKVLELQLQQQSFQWIFTVDFLYDWLLWSCSPRNSQESSPAPQFKSINSLVLAFFMVQLSHLYMTTGKTIALTIGSFVFKVTSLLFNTLSRFGS